MENVSARVELMGNMEAAKAELVDGLLKERGRGFASDQEAWAELKKRMENLAANTKDAEKVLKEMWDAVKDGNGDAFSALAHEMERAAMLMSMDWAEVAAMAKISLELTEG
jgi:hypothetical protein